MLDFSNWVKSSEGFLQKEIPPTLQQYLTSIIITDIGLIMLAVILWTVFGILMRKSYTMWQNDPNKGDYFWVTDDFTAWQTLRVIAFALLIPTLIVTVAEAYPAVIELIKCHFTPRIVIIEHLTRLLK